jgi:hypothetical protein
VVWVVAAVHDDESLKEEAGYHSRTTGYPRISVEAEAEVQGRRWRCDGFLALEELVLPSRRVSWIGFLGVGVGCELPLDLIPSFITHPLGFNATSFLLESLI